MPKIICLHTLTGEQAERIRQAAPAWELIHGKDKELWLDHLQDAEIVVGWNKSAEEVCLKKDSKLRWVQNWGAGVDKLPLGRLADRGAILTNASGVHAFPISETIYAMMLAFTRKLHLSVRHQLHSEWKGTGSLGEIHGKTIGIIGVGAIGEETARLAKAFGMKVLGVRRSGQPSGFVDAMHDLNGLAAVLQESDFVVVTLPLTDETRHMFGKAQFELMKPTAMYINIGRGGTTDTEALIEALRTGVIAGAGLDVFEQEPLPASSPLWQMENVIMTPHNSGSTEQYNERAFEILMRNLQDYLQGREPSVNRVDYGKQY
ncbi:Glyoxylate/hydroxypyruvate reductase B [Paenibacillus konkukensis]|uniref:Glyoxylate/hydroxypyruvate reductase B n=1 Tax=Paenibacillus konkukensis TaxID=2020716 RepID=A0ABY4RLR2_9BACL|nr:D-2-hydroxyacid dehydrogenase [Paenibacillus konkukensis]UQZ82252.1 Glyoxylate/hydroxypyruvate reductase B [Paenibacillus konkukensis]